MHLQGRFLKIGLVLWIAFSVAVAFGIANRTRSDAHPDERIHIDAFCFYQSNWWLPDLNSDQLMYSPDGWSRVYNGELVYLIYGRAGGAIKYVVDRLDNVPVIRSIPIVNRLSSRLQKEPGCSFKVHRFFNVLLLALTLSCLYFFSRNKPLIRYLLFVFLCLPQVTYIYAYANSDAWGLSASIFLFLYIMMQNEILQSLRKTLILALLVTLVILSKQNYWLSLPFSLGIFIWKTLEAQSLPLKTIARNAVILCVVTLSLSSPYYILYPLSQGDYSGKAELMRAQRSSPNFRPVNSLNKSYRMASKGKPFTAVALSKDWMDNSLKSLYGLFGYFQLKLPGELYRFLGWVAVLLLLDVILTTVLDWRNLSGFQRFLLIGSFVSVNLHFLGSMYNSWTYDFQPQGRYLFSMIPALACFLFLTAHQPFRWKKIFRGSVLVLGMVLSVVTLSLVLSSPILR